MDETQEVGIKLPVRALVFIEVAFTGEHQKE